MPTLLFISANSRLRRLYHRFAESVDCEYSSAGDVAEGLVHMMLKRPSIVMLDHSLPVFEVTILLEMLEKRPELNTVPLLAIGYDQLRHLFPPQTRFATSEEDIVRELQDCSVIL